MSDFMQALIISGSIFAVMMVSQLGRREYTWHKVLLPLLSVAGFGYYYLKDAPFGGNATWLYLVGIVIGAVFAVFATVTTGLERGSDGKVYTSTGSGFVATWLVAVLLRIGFVWGVTNVAGFRDHVGVFMFNHQLTESTIAPFFVLMALTTVIGRVVALKIRTNRLAVANVTVTELVTV
jgi:hypothetical protein